MQVGFAFDAANRITVPPRLSHIDVDGNLPQPPFDHEALEEFGMLDERLPVRHQHWNGANRDRVTNDLDQLVPSPRFPVGVRDVAAGNLESAAGTLQAAVRVDLFLDLRQRRDRDFVRVFREITMRAMERAVARSERETAMRQ